MDLKLTYRLSTRLVLVTGLCLLSLQPSAYKMATPGYMSLVHAMTSRDKLSLPSKAGKLYKRCSFNREEKKILVDQSREAGRAGLHTGEPPLLMAGSPAELIHPIPLSRLRPFVLRI